MNKSNIKQGFISTKVEGLSKLTHKGRRFVETYPQK